MEFGTFVHSIAENIDFANPDYSYIKNEKLKEENLGLIELIKSNTLEEVSYIVENTKTEESLYDGILQKINVEDKK